MQITSVRSLPLLLVAALCGCAELATTGSDGPAGDCDNMRLILNDPTQPEFLKDQVRQAMNADGCV